MKFFEHLTHYDYAKKFNLVFGEDEDEYCRKLIRICLEYDTSTAGLVAIERDWRVAGSPYYCVYPAIAKAFSRLRLDIPVEKFTLPCDPLCLRFAEGPIRTAMVSSIKIKTGEEGYAIYCDAGERESHYGYSAPVFWNNRWPNRGNFEEHIRAVKLSEKELETVKLGMRIALACCLLAEDDELVQPDVLNRDKGKPVTQTIINRAHKRGKKGWIIGSHSVSPHYRSEHFGIRWVGKGKTIPKLTKIRASLVHRSKVTNVPTGYGNA